MTSEELMLLCGGAGEDSGEHLGTARSSVQSILKETNPGHVLEGLMLKPRGAPPGSGHSPIWRMPDRLQHGLHRSEQ